MAKHNFGHRLKALTYGPGQKGSQEKNYLFLKKIYIYVHKQETLSQK